MGLDIVEMVMAVEDEFGIEIPNEEAEQSTTVGLLFECVRRRVEPDAPAGSFTGPAWDRYLAVVARELGFAPEQLRPSARFVQDLHAN
jgi:hypothetical protein